MIPKSFSLLSDLFPPTPLAQPMRENRNDGKQTEKIENKIKTNNIVKNCLQLIILLLQDVFVEAVVVAM